MNGFIKVLSSAPASRVLFVDGKKTITAGDIRAAARRAIGWLGKSQGPVFIHTESAAMLCAGLLAGLAARRSVAILPHAKPDYLKEIGADASHLMTDAGAGAPLTIAPGDTSPLSAEEEADIVFFTSGSTGAPKQVVRKMSHLDAEAIHWAKTFAGEIDHVAGTVSHQHMYGITFRVLLAVVAGWPSTDRQDLIWETFVANLTSRSLAVTSPAHLSRIPGGLAMPNGPPALMLSAGQLLPLPAAIEANQVFGKPVMEIYGSTESGGVATRRRTDDSVPWAPLPDTDLSLDPDGALIVATPFLGDDSHLMGDRVELLPDGRFVLLGRNDKIVKIEGKRVSLSRIEEALKALPEIHDAAIIALEGESGAALGAVVALKPEHGVLLGRLGSFRLSRHLRKQLTSTLEAAELPKRWRFVGRIPVNTQGKRATTELAKLFETSSLLKELNAQLVEFGEDSAKIEFSLAPDIAWFDGHFPGQPILAGLAQTHIAVRLGEEIWGFSPGSFQIGRLKFKSILQPGDSVTLQLSRDIAKARLTFAFTASGKAASEGVVGV